MESVSPSSLESQKNEITQLMQTSISVESVWYVVCDLSAFEKVNIAYRSLITVVVFEIKTVKVANSEYVTSLTGVAY